MDTDYQIESAARQCIQRFRQCLEVPALQESEWVENRLAQMNLWVSKTGACAPGRASLDSRLAAMPETRDVIANSLRLLAIVIDKYRTLNQPHDTPPSHHREEDPASSQDEDQTPELSPTINDSSSDDVSPDEYGSDDSISDESVSDESSSDDQPEDDYDTNDPPKELLQQSMYDIKMMQNQLFEIAASIRRPGDRSQLLKADLWFKATELQELEDHLVGILLVRLKRCFQEEHSRLNEVQLRLVRCNLKRRNRFLHAQRQGPSSRPYRFINSAAVSMPEDSTAPIDLDYPRPPRLDGNGHDFQCPYCCEKLPAIMADDDRWREHIADDLAPYTCIVAGCDQPDVLFTLEEDWREHVLKDHSSVTWTCFPCGNGARFGDKNTFVQHTKSCHAASISPDQIPVLTELSKKATPPEIKRCPLCNWPEEEGVTVDLDVLLKHIARDIHAFSLHALTWANDKDQGSLDKKASTVLSQGQLKKVEPFPDTLTSMASLASTYRDQGECEEAEQLPKQGMKISENRPDALPSMISLRRTCVARGQREKAAQRQARMMTMLKVKHPHVR
ncbi:hypothetical protein P170DRAFT_432984 [Aspergillus steynii IBT 23096]|uniref:C2H2-type domain-containing protein n=1 Tax=Aspergillus steynii IBT 23096 TaxID=1392250 RepID=A0A2I2GRE2_9EURO|nr:uncharacterized protein P170DRAFT_432984 [Aspergillus steynii IBT 23096]PLB55447.1 hypothetical protein P170DRAFT_432984 [Aspergillus steynii IBT 23096]